MSHVATVTDRRQTCVGRVVASANAAKGISGLFFGLGKVLLGFFQFVRKSLDSVTESGIVPKGSVQRPFILGECCNTEHIVQLSEERYRRAETTMQYCKATEF
uniref:SFRICE_006099 n=1 Tax=Spodoptera frugiperda TaxID=7108 RepID=A0A2H1VNV8_SPOFR